MSADTEGRYSKGTALAGRRCLQRLMRGSVDVQVEEVAHGRLSISS